MTTNYAISKAEVKKLVLTKGLKNIINADLNEIRDRTGVTVTDLQNAVNYFEFSPKTAKYRV